MQPTKTTGRRHLTTSLCCLLVVSVCVFAGCEKPLEPRFSKASSENSGETNSDTTVTSEAGSVVKNNREKVKNVVPFSHQAFKNRTLLLLASQPFARVHYLTSFCHEFLTREQAEEAVELIEPYQEKFDKLRKQRSNILATSSKHEDTNALISKVYDKTIRLRKIINGRIRNEILTDSQRRKFVETRAEESREKEAKKQSATQKQSATLKKGQ